MWKLLLLFCVCVVHEGWQQHCTIMASGIGVQMLLKCHLKTQTSTSQHQLSVHGWQIAWTGAAMLLVQHTATADGWINNVTAGLVCTGSAAGQARSWPCWQLSVTATAELRERPQTLC
jgi:hypothetical protein